MDKELKRGEMEENTLENLKMINHTEKGLSHILTDQNILENLKMANGTDKGL